MPAFLDQIAGTPDGLPPNASFADALHTMEIIQAVVRSAQSDGAAVAVTQVTPAEGSKGAVDEPARANPAAPA